MPENLKVLLEQESRVEWARFKLRDVYVLAETTKEYLS